MAVAGIIAEYNPFHAGHLYHIARTRGALGADAGIVVCMSGHVVQRGEFPCATKVARAKMAVLGGADLVFELPAPCVLAGAERFARAGVALLAELGIVTHLSFGSESGDLERLLTAARDTPESYPKELSLARAMPKLFAHNAAIYTPNNILALEYLRALRALNFPMEPLTIRREGSAHDDKQASASAIRARLSQGRRVSVPYPDILEGECRARRAPIELRRLETAILSRLRALTAAEFSALPDMRGGFDDRLRKAVRSAASLNELYEAVKSKRFTHARVRRAVLCAFLGIQEQSPAPPPRLLAIGARGEELLSKIKCPMISRPAAHRQALELESRITDQLCLAMPKPLPCGQEWLWGVTKVSL